MPYTVDSGAPFPDRDTIVFVTAGVVVVTLVVQGLVLPGVARWARLPDDTDGDRELHLAQTTATEAALTALPDAAAELGTDPDVAEQLRTESYPISRPSGSPATSATNSEIIYRTALSQAGQGRPEGALSTAMPVGVATWAVVRRSRWVSIRPALRSVVACSLALALAMPTSAASCWVEQPG